MVEQLSLIANLIGFFPILIYHYLKNKRPKDATFLFPFVVLITLASIYEIVATLILRIPTKIWFRTYTLLEFLCLLYFFKNIVKKSPHWLYKSCLFIYLCAYVGLLFFWNSTYSLETDSYLSILQVVMVYVYTIIWIKELFENHEKRSVLEYSSFYFIAGILVYLSGSLVLLILGQKLLFSNNEELQNYWAIISIFTIFVRIMIGYGLWKGQLKPIDSDLDSNFKSKAIRK